MSVQPPMYQGRTLCILNADDTLLPQNARRFFEAGLWDTTVRRPYPFVQVSEVILLSPGYFMVTFNDVTSYDKAHRQKNTTPFRHFFGLSAILVHLCVHVGLRGAEMWLSRPGVKASVIQRLYGPNRIQFYSNPPRVVINFLGGRKEALNAYASLNPQRYRPQGPDSCQPHTMVNDKLVPYGANSYSSGQRGVVRPVYQPPPSVRKYEYVHPDKFTIILPPSRNNGGYPVNPHPYQQQPPQQQLQWNPSPAPPRFQVRAVVGPMSWECSPLPSETTQTQRKDVIPQVVQTAALNPNALPYKPPPPTPEFTTSDMSLSDSESEEIEEEGEEPQGWPVFDGLEKFLSDDRRSEKAWVAVVNAAWDGGDRIVRHGQWRAEGRGGDDAAPVLKEMDLDKEDVERWLGSRLMVSLLE